MGIKCIEGYKLEGASETLCKNGQWTNPLGKCKGLCLQITEFSHPRAHMNSTRIKLQSAIGEITKFIF